MRNLKKFLALVLAMMMALSLMVTANAAVTENVVYPDDYKVDPAFEEAVTVLSGMGVFHGDNGDFKPADSITRAEVAAIIYRLITADVNDDQAALFRNVTHPFTDVTSDKWYAGYVGYLWNAGIIKGTTATTFNPAGNVTGYEALAMILRAVGYDKQNEFTGGNWVLNVAAIANNKGILSDVDKTNYGGPMLYSAARRDVVASLLFNAAQIPQVMYTAAFQYQDTGMVDGVTGNVKNPSLGYAWFGLTNHKGVVVGNEATGEGDHVTKIGFTYNSTQTGNYWNGYSNIVAVPIYGDYVYDKDGEIVYDANGDPIREFDHWEYTVDQNTSAYTTYDNSIINDKVGVSDGAYRYGNARSFKWDSGLELFGHAVSVWYDDRGSANKDTYAVFDKATLVEVVDGVTTEGSLTLDTEGGDNELYDAADDAGFKVGDMTNWNYSFGRSKYGNSSWNQFTSPIKVNNQDETHDEDLELQVTKNPLYLLISNSDDKTLDLVISLDMTITQITQVNDTTGNYSVGVFTGNGSGSMWFDEVDKVTSAYGDEKTYSNILKNALVGNSTQTLGDKVAAIEITGTTGRSTSSTVYYGNNDASDADGNYNNTSKNSYATQSNYYYQLSKLTHVVTATVVRYDASNETVYLSDGSKMAKSVFANAVDGDFKDNQFVNAPRRYGTYSFTLDDKGDYIYWETITETSNFVYGTYIDYTTVTASSSFDYPLVYVDTTGAKGQANISKVDGKTLDANVYSNLDLNKRNATNITDAGYVKGAYIGYALSANGELTPVTPGDDKSTGFYQATEENFGDDEIKITSKEVSIGALGFGEDGNLMLTENTVFYIVNGAGNNNQKVDTYNGISDLMKDMSAVTINVVDNETSIWSKDSTYLSKVNGDDMSTVNHAYQEVYYKAGRAEYGQNYLGSAEEVKVVYIPAACVKFTPAVSSNLFFLGDSSSKMINSYGEDAVLYTMYQNGVEDTYWIEGKLSDDALDGAGNGSSVGTIVANEGNVFYCLTPTSSKAQDGRTIYAVAPVVDAEHKVIGQYLNEDYELDDVNVVNGEAPALYAATTYSSQIAYIDGTGHAGNNELWNVGNAEVLNLNKRAYPGINNTLSSLNNAGSITDNRGVPVSCVLDSADTNYRTVSFIYVNA